MDCPPFLSFGYYLNVALPRCCVHICNVPTLTGTWTFYQSRIGPCYLYFIQTSKQVNLEADLLPNEKKASLYAFVVISLLLHDNYITFL